MEESLITDVFVQRGFDVRWCSESDWINGVQDDRVTFPYSGVYIGKTGVRSSEWLNLCDWVNPSKLEMIGCVERIESSQVDVAKATQQGVLVLADEHQSPLTLECTRTSQEAQSALGALFQLQRGRSESVNGRKTCSFL